MQSYITLVKSILNDGVTKIDRTGVGTKSIFNANLTFDLRKSFPLVSVKETKYKAAFIEMLWFLRGESNINFLHEHNVNIWNEWADENGELGRIYGVQWRNWTNSNNEVTDQIANLIHDLKTNPDSRRLLVTAWNPGELKQMALPPCHRSFQCYVSDGYIDLKWDQRSVDVMLGLPFNIAGYALLLHMLAEVTNLKPRFLHASLGDCHIYSNHLEAAESLLSLPTFDNNAQLVIHRKVTDIDDFTIDDFSITNYKHGPFIKLPVAV
jgi:thymidylate synthase